MHPYLSAKTRLSGHRNHFLLAVTLLISGLILSSCLFAPLQRAVLTQSEGTLSSRIHGLVWIDRCASGDDCQTVTPDLSTDGLVDEQPEVEGIQGLEVSLGQGPCPSLGYADQRTNGAGFFSFEDLESGFYCVTVQAADSLSGEWVTPPGQRSERSVSQTIALGQGENLHDLQFVWRVGEAESAEQQSATPTTGPTCTNRLSLITDVTVEAGTRIDPLGTFAKVWRIRNDGSCIWSSDYEWVFLSGYQLGAPEKRQLGAKVLPGVMIDISLGMTAPPVPGTYRSSWMMRSPAGELFGSGTGHNQPVVVEIIVGQEPSPVITHWRGEYFNNSTLEEPATLVRNDERIDFDWGRGSPAAGLPNDGFSARWTRMMEFEEGIYRFTLSADDGVRMWVDDRLVVDEWQDAKLNEASVDLAMVSGDHSIVVEYYENTIEAEVELDWDEVTLDDDDEWIARFWFNRTRDSKWALVDTSSSIDYDWGRSSPAEGIPKNDFSASWTRSAEFDHAEYRFSAKADDGVRFYLDDELLIDAWHDAPPVETYTVDRELEGSHDLQVIYYERSGDARITFGWEEIGAANQAPSAAPDDYVTLIDTPLNILDPGVLENDTDPDNDALTAIEISGPDHGSLDLHENGAFGYEPEPGYVGEDTFTYHASDGVLQSSETAVTITIRLEDQLPSAVDDSVQTPEDTPVTIDVLTNDQQLADQPIVISSVSTPSAGEAVVDGVTIIYTPDQNYSGNDNFTYTIADRDDDQSSANVSVSVTAVNDAPVANPEDFSLPEDESLTVPAPGLLANDTDVDSGTLTAQLNATVQHGSLALNANGSFTYTPDPDYYGDDQFTYQASDGGDLSQPAVVSIDVQPVDDLPVASPDSYSMLLEPELQVSAPGVLANDEELDGETLSAVLDQDPTHGSLSFETSGGFRYTPDAGFDGIDMFSYWAEDASGRSTSVTVTIEVITASP